MPSIPERAQPLGEIVVRTAYRDGVPSRAVVCQADPRSLISLELLAAPAADIEGALTQDGDLVSFGTDGYGLGRVTYRIVSRDALWATAEREA
jgi:hypothetical protein